MMNQKLWKLWILWLHLRPQCMKKQKNFEKEFSSFQSCSESIMVNSGSSADLLLSFLLTNPIEPILKGDEVLIASITWPTHIWSIMIQA